MKLATLLLLTVTLAFAQGGWKKIFDGKSLDGWEINENPQSWSVKDGAITGDGPRSHIFYMREKCVNCEFKAEVRLNKGGNSGMYFRAKFGPGWPPGYEAQVNNSHSDPVRTGSLYNLSKVFDQLVPDDTWWTQHIIANGNHVIIHVNDKKVVDFVDEKNSYTEGHVAFQQHNQGSIVQYRNIMLKVLPAKP